MRLQRRIFWTTLLICILSLFCFVAFKTFWFEYDYEIFSNISIGIFGSSLLVFVPALITFFKIKSDTKQKIISELSKIENLVNDLQFKTTFIKDFNREYSLDFSFEKTKYDDNSDTSLYLARKDAYEINVKRVESLYQTITEIDNFDYSFFDFMLFDYVGIFHNEKYIQTLFNKYWDIIESVMISKYQLPYAYGARQYECCNASVGQFFDIWFKGFLIKIEPLDAKLENLKSILKLIRVEFYSKDYTAMLNCEDQNIKQELVSKLKAFHAQNDIKPSKKINRLLNRMGDGVEIVNDTSN